MAGINRKDHPDYADAHAESAVWADTGEQLPDADLERITMDPDLMDELIQSHLQGEADYFPQRKNSVESPSTPVKSETPPCNPLEE